MTPQDFYWLVGLLEGEGCFTISKSRYRGAIYLYPRLALNMTDEDVVARAAALLGAKYHRVKTATKDTFQTRIISAPALTLMRKLLPHMSHRRQSRIRELLAMFDADYHWDGEVAHRIQAGYVSRK